MSGCSLAGWMAGWCKVGYTQTFLPMVGSLLEKRLKRQGKKGNE